MHKVKSTQSRSTLNNFLKQINRKMICSPPHNNNAKAIADQASNGTSFQMLSGKDLLKQNVEREAHRLKLPYNTFIIDSATNKFWSRLTRYKKRQFENLAILANNINIIIQIPEQQITDNPLENDFFNGTKFHKNNNNLDPLFYQNYSFF